ncbi:Na(+)/H(+) antiporter subunit D [Granulosicoccus antarcticus]|uniref:Na(+)/H(+) antiporter subunit A n=1 Tax=Granulosicoccus antarcticus IMCC3135 TaxID=1192854 RepID=A0A2Z2NNY0_9GAMM|nr:Na(+)/H(+) antiporter subunit D [Granulosicoccus antarcticus]ASJ72943.1 Na(+)/H(+) antiporter subunit A [Granulosicoccus antarcticus IMCC3135]
MSTIMAPPFIYLLAALICPFLPSRLRALLLLGVPIFGLMVILAYPMGDHAVLSVVGFDLTFMRIDKLSLIFSIIFSIAAFLGGLYAWHVRDTIQQVATLAYAGSAIGGVFAGDLISLFLWWEGTAVASVFLIWARRTPAAYSTGMRYLIIQVLSGVLLLAGLLVHYNDTGSIAFEHLGLVSTGTFLIFLSFGIKCAFPLMHNWLQDAYPAATVTGTVILSSFTTKMAIYALARGYAGTEILIYIGAIMTLFPIFFAEIENDLRRVLAYSLNNQLGFMVVGIGIGTELAINGTAAHAFAHILYKSLLFMTVGAVLYRTGTSKASELGGLYKTMPVTMVCCLVGAASISAFPLFSGFVSKSLILDASASNGYYVVWLALLVASAGVMSHSGIKIPYFTFFAHDSGKRPAEAPIHMRIAMIVTAALCIIIGVFPGLLYALLPYEIEYQPYTVDHVLVQMQLLIFALLAFVFLMKKRIHPPEVRATNIDSDVVYRKWIPSLLPAVVESVVSLNLRARQVLLSIVGASCGAIERLARPGAPLARGWSVASMMFVVIIFMCAVLVLNLL